MAGLRVGGEVDAVCTPVHDAVYLNQTSLLHAVPVPWSQEAGTATALLVALVVSNAAVPAPIAVAVAHSSLAGAAIELLQVSE